MEKFVFDKDVENRNYGIKELFNEQHLYRNIGAIDEKKYIFGYNISDHHVVFNEMVNELGQYNLALSIVDYDDYKKITSIKTTYKIKIIRRYFEDIRFKNLVILCFSSIINFSFIFIKFVNGVTSKSIWFVSLSIYYFLLIVIKLFLLNNLKNFNKNKEYVVYKRVGYFIMILNILLIIMIIQMIRSNSIIKSDPYIVYLTATYTFYLIISAIVNLVKYRKFNSPILSSIKSINFISASVSVLMLQTTMIMTFGDNELEFMKLMNKLTGSFVSVITMGISVYMIINGRRNVEEGKK